MPSARETKVNAATATLGGRLAVLEANSPWTDQILRHNTGVSFHLHENGSLYKIKKNGSDGRRIDANSNGSLQWLKIASGQVSSFLKINGIKI